MKERQLRLGEMRCEGEEQMDEMRKTLKTGTKKEEEELSECLYYEMRASDSMNIMHVMIA